MYSKDRRIVITLDAGGTNFVFGAMQANKPIVEPITTPSNAHDLDLCLKTMADGFEQVINMLDEKPVAISFAFPGPADYPNGIIGGYLPNFPSFRDGVALGRFLKNKFGIPVFINNDGDLYAYGEALGGMLSSINQRLGVLGSNKQYHNLIGYTFGTGFGVGVVVGGKLNLGDNSCVETFCLPHKNMQDIILEEGVSVRAVKRVYGELSGDKDHNLEPKDIFEIAEGTKEGNQQAAKDAFAEFGEVAGYAMSIAVTLIDGIIVVGGGICAASKYIMPSLLSVLRSKLSTLSGESVNRVQMEVFDLNNSEEFVKFAKGDAKEITVYGSKEKVVYDPCKRIGIAISDIGASNAIAIGAYAFALNKLDSDPQYKG